MPAAEASLITVDEAQKIVADQGRVVVIYRNPLMILAGAIFLTCGVLLVMVVLSLRGAKTGLGSVLPFLENQQTQQLQVGSD